MSKMPAKKIIWRLFLSIVLSATALLLALVLGIFYIKHSLPVIKKVSDYNPPQTTKIYSDEGELIGQFYQERRTLVPLNVIPKHVIQAFIAAEDANFYNHTGLDYQSILRALIKNLRPGAHLQGGSTITQQTVKSLILGPERSYLRKIKEALLAQELERLLSKNEILTIYLNQIYFGSGAYGIQEAAETHLGKNVQDLTLAEAALLAGIPKNPSKYLPKKDSAACKERQLYVLTQMKEAGFIKEADVQKALNSDIALNNKTPEYLDTAPYYLEHVKRLLGERYGLENVYKNGYKVYTGMSTTLQTSATKQLRLGLENLAKTQGYLGPSFKITPLNLPKTLPLLRESLKARLANSEGSCNFLWDLTNLSKTNIRDLQSIKQNITYKPWKKDQTLRAVVISSNDLTNEALLDLGCTLGRIPFKSVEWAKPFDPSNKTKTPKKISEVFQEGDIVLVNIKSLTPSPKLLLHQKTIEVELIAEPKIEGALVVIDPHTRAVKALVGGYEQNMGLFNRATQAYRQPGSAFKPLIYAAGLLSKTITPASICTDAPFSIQDPTSGKIWKPENFEGGKYDGDITYRRALTRSKNICSIKLLQETGVQKTINLALKMGIKTKLPNNLTLALGSGDVTPLELANAYTTIAALGLFAEPVFITKVLDKNKQIIFTETDKTTEVLEPAAAYVLTDMMRSVVEEGTAMRALVLDRPIAGKTGTSNESRNVWFSGFTKDLVATLWVGFDDNSSLGRATGSNTALPIWINFMKEAIKDMPKRDFIAPPNVVFMKVDADTGELSNDIGSIEEVFISGTEPQAKSEHELPSLFIEDNKDAPPTEEKTPSKEP